MAFSDTGEEIGNVKETAPPGITIEATSVASTPVESIEFRSVPNSSTGPSTVSTPISIMEPEAEPDDHHESVISYEFEPESDIEPKIESERGT